MCMHQLTLHPNLKHAIERVERPGGSHEGVGRKKNLDGTIVHRIGCQQVVTEWHQSVHILNGQ